jgi:hypothetical protein
MICRRGAVAAELGLAEEPDGCGALVAASHTSHDCEPSRVDELAKVERVVAGTT